MRLPRHLYLELQLAASTNESSPRGPGCKYLPGCDGGDAIIGFNGEGRGETDRGGRQSHSHQSLASPRPSPLILPVKPRCFGEVVNNAFGQGGQLAQGGPQGRKIRFRTSALVRYADGLAQSLDQAKHDTGSRSLYE